MVCAGGQEYALNPIAVRIGGSRSQRGNGELVKQGLAMGVYLDKGSPRLIINRRAAKIEGLDLVPAIDFSATTIK